MTKMLLDHIKATGQQKEVIVTFANTGQEHEETLIFVDRCDREFGFGVVWVEAAVSPEKGVGVSHRIVDFKTASRNGEPFEAYIKKYGIPNVAYKQCTTRLKTDPMESYRRTSGWIDHATYLTAVGIRFDEADRMSFSAMKNLNVFYPLVDSEVTKDDVVAWWGSQSFKLGIPEQLGNCVWCWKKSMRKLLTIAKDSPEHFDFPARMERENSMAGGPRRDGEEKMPRVFFRGNKSTKQLLAEAAKGEFVPFVDEGFVPFDDELDVGGGCGASCEVHSDED